MFMHTFHMKLGSWGSNEVFFSSMCCVALRFKHMQMLLTYNLLPQAVCGGLAYFVTKILPDLCHLGQQFPQRIILHHAQKAFTSTTLDLILGMCLQTCGFTFSIYRLMPMGSYPQIADKKGTHDLYGPVNRLMCAGYDRAMVMFLTCVKVIALTILVQSLKACCLSCVRAATDNRLYRSWFHPLTCYVL